MEHNYSELQLTVLSEFFNGRRARAIKQEHSIDPWRLVAEVRAREDAKEFIDYLRDLNE